mmetsp:Transcript_5745/g.4937  ORF Transcript_5745/g.4937 Transcript_5745/m.4937 type:complete len:154 (+) Transcript_5745:335-796(+)
MMINNNVDPNLKFKMENKIQIQREKDGLMRIQAINEKSISNSKISKCRFYSKKREIESQIFDLRNMLKKSEEKRSESYNRIERLSPQFSHASILIKKRAKKMKKNEKMKNKLLLANKRRERFSSRLTQSVIGSTAIKLNKEEFEKMTALQKLE